jgi:hypothetical protein
MSYIRPLPGAGGPPGCGADDLIIVRLAGLCVLLAACLAAPAAPARAAEVEPRSAAAFRDSVGVTTHIVYFGTAYGNWPRVVDRLRELGVGHVRDGVYANPAPQWRAWNERYYRAVELAAAHGIRFAFGMGRPGSETGTIDQLLGVVGGRLRHAAAALEAPNEFDRFVGGPRWPARLAAYGRELYRKAKARPSVRSLPVIGPSLTAPGAALRLGDQRRWLDAGNIHPYTGGLSPGPPHLRSELGRIGAVSGRKPVWATEAGFHNALRARVGQPPVSEAAGAVYLLRTFLEHFRAGIPRTYAYELLDEQREPARRNPEQHFGLLRSDFSRKPAFVALRNLLALMGPATPPGRLRPLRMTLERGPRDLRSLVLQRADGRHLLVLWRLAPVWNREARRPLRVAPRRVSVRLPAARAVRAAHPVADAAPAPLRLRRDGVRVRVGASPVVLEIEPRDGR